jgi:hypothetical protein
MTISLSSLNAGFYAGNTGPTGTKGDKGEFVSLTINSQTGTTYSLATSDAFKIVTLANTSAVTVTVPTNVSQPFSNGTTIHFVQTGAGQVTFSNTGSSGVILNATPGFNTRAQYSTASLICLGTDNWVLVGDLAA